MGLDVSVIKTPKNINLEEIYAVCDAIEQGFSWYLGDDNDSRGEKWIELKEKCKSLTRKEVLASISEPKNLVKCIEAMSDETFNVYMTWIVYSITEHQDGNTHLNFDYDKLPGKTLFDSRSWNLRDLFLNCKKDDRSLAPCDDFICELDPKKVCVMSKNWKRHSFKIWLAKWIGYFSGRVGFNILQDCMYELNVKDTFVEVFDAERYKNNILKVEKDILDNDDDRYWLISSY